MPRARRLLGVLQFSLYHVVHRRHGREVPRQRHFTMQSTSGIVGFYADR